MKKSYIVLLLGICIVNLLGCETAKGAGKDIEKTGENIQETIEKNQ